MFALDRNTAFEDSASQAKQMDFDRIAEQLTIFGIEPIPVTTTNKVDVNCIINNTGSLSVHLVRLWVKDTNNSAFNSVDTAIVLEPGNIKQVNRTVNVLGAAKSDMCSFWFVTSRGNTFTVAIPQQIATFAVVGGIGSVILNFDDFKYYNVIQEGSSWKLSNFPQGLNGYSIYMPKGCPPIAFRVKLTNLDPQGRFITLDARSVLFSVFPGIQQPRGDFWYIVNVNAVTGTISSPSFTAIPLPYGEEVAVFFASAVPMGSDFKVVDTNQVFSGTSPVNLALTGTIGGNEHFGQNLPFVAIYINNENKLT
jgi:hypothetical protein